MCIRDRAPEARAVIEKQGVVYTDQEGDLVTSIVNNKDCVFTCYDEKGCFSVSYTHLDVYKRQIFYNVK